MVELCESCSIKGQTETNQCLRAWDYYLQNNFCCIRRAVLVITVDCESGNKQCLKRIQQELLDGTIRQYLSLFSILPYVPHFLKACKANFANLYLQLNNEGGCLLLLYKLRNRADPKVRENLKIYTLVRVAVDNDLTRNSTTYHSYIGSRSRNFLWKSSALRWGMIFLHLITNILHYRACYLVTLVQSYRIFYKFEFQNIFGKLP